MKCRLGVKPTCCYVKKSENTVKLSQTRDALGKMPLMIFYCLRDLPKEKPLLVIAAALLFGLLQGCTASPLQPQMQHVFLAAPQHNQPTQRLEQVPISDDDAGCTTAHVSSEMLSRVNRLRASGAVCGATRYPPAAPLRWSTKLQQAAALHSQDMASHNFFNHKSATNGSTLPERLRAVGYKYQAAGENIGAGVYTVAQVIDLWVASPGHCVTLMTANFVELGASCQNSSHSYYKTYWTLKAATPM